MFIKKVDAKSILIRWMMLLQEFNLEIKDKSETGNLVDDHLNRIPQSMETPHLRDFS